MSPRPHPASRSLRERPGLVAAVVFAGLATLLAMSVITSGGDVDVASAAFYGVAPVLFTAVGAVILAQVPGHGVGRLSLALGLLLTVSASLVFLITLVDPFGPVEVVLSGPAGMILQVALALSEVLPSIALVVGGAVLVVWFPDGRPGSKLGLLAQALVIVAIAGAVLSDLPDVLLDTMGSSPALEAVVGVASAGLVGALGAAYVVAMLDLANRYRSADQLRRTQMRWVLAAVCVEVGLTVLTVLLGGRVDWLWGVWIASTILPIIAIAIAITRNHLYDIDRIVSRTIAYSIVSVVLAGILVAGVVALQTILAPWTRGDTFPVALSTLGVAALFQPLRSRVQRAVDRRFNRARYDAERTVESLAADLRADADLDLVIERTSSTVARVFEPQAVGLWRREPYR